MKEEEVTVGLGVWEIGGEKMGIQLKRIPVFFAIYLMPLLGLMTLKGLVKNKSDSVQGTCQHL